MQPLNKYKRGNEIESTVIGKLSFETVPQYVLFQTSLR